MGKTHHHFGRQQTPRSKKSSDMTEHKFDEIDLRILRVLQLNARGTNTQVGKEAGITQAPTLRRTKLMEARGIIRGYHAVLENRMLGFDVMVFNQVALRSQASKSLGEFEAAMAGIPNVRECHALAGKFDFLLKCVFRDLAEAHSFVVGVLQKLENVESVTTAFCIRVTKNESEVPLVAE